MIHELKTWVKPYNAVKDGDKRFELRKDDRGFKVGDWLHLRQYDHEISTYTGEDCVCRIEYILRDFAGLQEGYCIMSITSGL